MTRPLLSALALLALAAPASLEAQSLLNAAGLGVPADPLDARTRALGGVGVGLQGAALLSTDPAAAAGFVLPSVMITAQPSWVDLGADDGVGAPETFRGTRFPNLGVAYPAPGLGVVTLSFESVFDQRYEAEREVTLDLGGGDVAVTDHFTSTGGVSQLRIGLARVVAQRIAVGLTAGRYTGSVVRRLVREFPDDDEPVEPYQVGGLWTYSGTSVTGGASVAIGSFAQLGGSLTWSSGLDADPSDDTDGAAGAFDLPLQLRVGATAVLAPGLAVTAGFSSADWSDIDDDLTEGTSVGSARSFGVGVELARASVFGRSAPLRFGYRTRDLPFVLDDGGAPTEAVWAGGLGLNLSQAGAFVRAAVDLAVERGTREDALFSESFWRGTVSVRVSGF
jgi:hypothetical protein